MKLSSLICAIDPTLSCPDVEITTVTDRPACANAQSIFVCIHGARANGHAFAPEAYRNGCRVFVAEEPLSLPADAWIVPVSATRQALAHLACAFYGHPSREMKIIGVTGTKGKTTVSRLLSTLLEKAGIPCGYVGTNGAKYRDVMLPLGNTTPDPLTLQRILRQMLDAGIQAAVLEISSQALYQFRADGISFEACVFTNLHSDHIGPTEHPTFAHYRDAKHRLFTDFAHHVTVVNADDPHTAYMLERTAAEKVVRYSMCDPTADYYAFHTLPTQSNAGYGISFRLTPPAESIPVFLPMLGTFNASNALAALSVAAECFGIDPVLSASLLQTAAVEGRTETLPLKNGACAVIDYAHNGIGLQKLLTSLRVYKPRRLICLFGSVGERSQLRRREMGDVAAKHADLAILTSDNPGNEDPASILADIAQAFSGTKTPYLAIPDRAEAIRTAVEMTEAGDILVLAGKGHESYQLIGNERVPFSERSILEEYQ